MKIFIYLFIYLKYSDRYVIFNLLTYSLHDLSDQSWVRWILGILKSINISHMGGRAQILSRLPLHPKVH